MKRTLTIVFAALCALAVHVFVLMFGGVLAAPAASHRGTEVRNVELRPGPKSPDRAPAAPAADEPKTPESSSTAEVLAKADAPAKSEAPTDAAAPMKTETPKALDATNKETKLAKSNATEPALAVTSAPPPVAVAPQDFGPAQLAAAQARDADVGGGDGELNPAAGATAAVASVEPSAAASDDAAESQALEEPLPISPMPVPMDTPSPVKPAVPEIATAAPAVRPAPQSLQIPSLSSPNRIGPAWSAVAARIGPVPPSSGVGPVVTVTPRRSREIPPVDILAATARTQVPYRPLNLGGRAPSTAALGAFVAPAPAVTPSVSKVPVAAPVAAVVAPAAPVSSVATPRTGAARSASVVGRSAGTTATTTAAAPSAAPARSAGAARAVAGPPSATAKTSAVVRSSGASGSGGPGGGQPTDRGTLAPGAQVRQEPVARIAWGNADEASRMIDIGRMQLVTVDSDLKVVAGIDGQDGAWTRTSAPAQMGSYSNRVRVVDHVAGFAGQSSLCGPGEHLAVIVPVGLDRRIEKAMDQAARREGLSRDLVAACYGRLVIQATGIEFEVDRVERRNTP
jgi:hypothetical protein